MDLAGLTDAELLAHLGNVRAECEKRTTVVEVIVPEFHEGRFLSEMGMALCKHLAPGQDRYYQPSEFSPLWIAACKQFPGLLRAKATVESMDVPLGKQLVLVDHGDYAHIELVDGEQEVLPPASAKDLARVAVFINTYQQLQQ